MQPRVVDISHHNTVTDLKATAMAGIWGIIHKSSQGRAYRDPDYAARRRLAHEAGLLWGAYHFNDGSDVAAQVDWFIKCAQPDDNTLLVLDFEDNPKSQMTVQQAVQFLRLLEGKTGRKGAIYSGNRLKETIGHLSAADHAYICSHRLWLCQYGPKAVLPPGFSHYWLWQYTGDGVGQEPHNVPGIVAGNGGLDLNIYDGNRDKLRSEWSGTSLLGAIATLASDGQSSHSSQAASDQRDVPTPAAPAAVHEAQGDAVLLDVQQRLKAMNYSPGIPSGAWGGMTAGAISGFLNDRQSAIAGPTSLEMFDSTSADIVGEIARAEAEHFVRPVTVARASADATTVATVAPEVVPMKQNRELTIWGAIWAFFAGIYKTFSGTISNAWDYLFGFVSDHKDDIPTDPGMLQTAWGYVAAIPVEVWIFTAAAGFIVLAIKAHSAVKQITESVQTGARQ